MMENIEKQNINNVEWKSLPNEIFIHIFDYLSKGDLDQVRLVCRSWRDLTSSPKFLKKLKLLINQNNLETIYEYLLTDKDLHKRVACDTLELHKVEVSEQIFVVLQTLNQHVRSLCLRSSPIFGMLNECLPELEELKMTTFEYVEKEEMRLLNLSGFKNFKSLDIIDSAMPNFVTTHLLRNVIDNPPFKMEKLFFGIKKETVHEELAVQAVKYHSNSLKQLGMCLRLQPMTNLYHELEELFPFLNNLENIKLIDFGLYEFLTKLVEGIPKEAPLRSFQLKGALRFDDKLLKLVLSKWSASLQNFCLHYCQDVTSDGFHNVGKLRKRLKRLTLTCNAKIDVNSLVEGLPPESMEDLVLMDNGRGVILLSDAQPNSEYRREIVNNHTLQTICQRQRKLRILALTECHNISDEGLISAPISNLRGLQQLYLTGNEDITDRSLMEALKFNELSRLQLIRFSKITSVGIKQLVRNCPALELVGIGDCDMIDDDAMLYIVRDLKRLRYLNISECPLVTIKTLDYIAEYGKYIKAIHICGSQLLQMPTFNEKLKTVFKDLNIVLDCKRPQFDTD